MMEKNDACRSRELTCRFRVCGIGDHHGDVGALMKSRSDDFLDGLVPDRRRVEFALDDHTSAAPAAMLSNNISALIASRFCYLSMPAGCSKSLGAKFLVINPTRDG